MSFEMLKLTLHSINKLVARFEIGVWYHLVLCDLICIYQEVLLLVVFKIPMHMHFTWIQLTEKKIIEQTKCFHMFHYLPFFFCMKRKNHWNLKYSPMLHLLSIKVTFNFRISVKKRTKQEITLVHHISIKRKSILIRGDTASLHIWW